MTTKESSSKENNKPAGFKSIMSALKPIRDWLKGSNTQNIIYQTPSISTPTIHHRRPTPIVEDTLLGLDCESNNNVQRDEFEEHFKRSAKSRMSMPIMHNQPANRVLSSTINRRNLPPVYSQHHLTPTHRQSMIYNIPQTQSLGHIYLQHKGETKQANLPNELTALDTIRALFVCAFPNILTMEYMSQPHVKIYIYNPRCNIFYELHNVTDVKHESVLRIHQSDPFPSGLHSVSQSNLHQLQNMQQHLPPSIHQYQTQHMPSIQQQQHHLLTPLQQNQQPQSQQQVFQSSPYQASVHFQSQIPPPKPRRMIPMVPNGLQSNHSSFIYGVPPLPSVTPQSQISINQQHHQMQTNNNNGMIYDTLRQ